MNENRRSFGEFSGKVVKSSGCEFEMGRDGCFVRIRERKINSTRGRLKRRKMILWYGMNFWYRTVIMINESQKLRREINSQVGKFVI